LQTEAIEVTHVSDPPAKAIRTKVMSLGEIQQDNVVRYPGVTPDGIDISTYYRSCVHVISYCNSHLLYYTPLGVFTSHIPPLHECVDKDEKWDIDFLITELAKMDEE
jgi:hypothetical protein